MGVTDTGSPSGLAISDELLLRLADIKTDGNIAPPPSMAVGKHVLSGRAVAIVTVQPSDTPPVRYRGRTWVRVGPRRAVATARDERILSEKRRHRDRHFDAQPVPNAGLTDLRIGVFQDEYLPAAIDPETLAANDRTLEERLAAAKMIASADDPVPTVAGVLALGKHPQDHLPGAYVQFLRIAGTEWGGDVLDEARCEGPIEDLIRRLDDKLVAHNRTAVDFLSTPVERRDSTYPISALQQLVRNAVMHRTYEGTNAPVQVYWFDDRIEIGSPGGPTALSTSETSANPESSTTAIRSSRRQCGCSAWYSATDSASPPPGRRCAKTAKRSRSSTSRRTGFAPRCGPASTGAWQPELEGPEPNAGRRPRSDGTRPPPSSPASRSSSTSVRTADGAAQAVGGGSTGQCG